MAVPEMTERLHRPAGPIETGIVLAHGAGSNADAKLLVALAGALCEAGFLVLRIDLAFRKLRSTGPPFPATAAKDRASILEAGNQLRELGARRVVLGGHSYGGRQATMLAAENPGAGDALLLLSYPLHPPAKPGEVRDGHFPALRVPAVFVHGVRDPFGTLEEMRSALKKITAPVRLIEVAGAGHELAPLARNAAAHVGKIVEALG